MIVHGCDWAEQGDVKLRCTGAYGEVLEGLVKNLPKLPIGVYHSSIGLYTFEKSLETCPECLKDT